MKNFKRFLAVVLSVMFIVTSAAVSISAGSNSKAWYNAAVEYLDELTISNIGATADEELSREEFVTWVAKLESHQLNEAGWWIWEDLANASFSDVDESDHIGAIGWSVNRGFIVGNNDGTDTTLPTFAPDRTVSLAEAAAVVVRMMGYADDVPGDTSNWAVNNIHVANTLCKAFDETFLTNVGTFDPAYKLTKGEGAWILYTIMNGKYYANDDTLPEGAKPILTKNKVDLGEFFANASKTNIKVQVMISDLSMKTKDGVKEDVVQKGYIFQRTDALAAGVAGNYAVLKTYNGWLNTEKDVSLAQVGTKTVPAKLETVDGEVFNALIRNALGLSKNDTTTNILESVEVGSVITLKMTKETYNALDTSELTADAVKNGKVTATINASYVSDTYIGKAAQASVDVRKGSSAIGWTVASAATSADNTYARISTNTLNWTNLSYNTNGSLKSADLVVGDQVYKVVTEYTGAANEIKVYAPNALINADGKLDLTKEVVSVVARDGDVVYAGATLDADNFMVAFASALVNSIDKAYWNDNVDSGAFNVDLDGDETAEYVTYTLYQIDENGHLVRDTYGREIVAKTAKIAKINNDGTYTLTSDVTLTNVVRDYIQYIVDSDVEEFEQYDVINGIDQIETLINDLFIENYSVSYTLNVEGGKVVTHLGLALVSDLFDEKGNLANKINTEKVLTAAEAYQLILSPAQGESNVVLSDVDGDGIYDIAVVTETTRALYYGNVNASVDPASKGYASDMVSNSVYDSFGNYITNTLMLKGMGVGGLVVDKTVGLGGTSGRGTDCWKLTNTSTDLVQLVVVGSNERRFDDGFSFQTSYGNSVVYPYDVIDVAELTTGYIKEVSTFTTIVDGVECFKLTMVNTSGKTSTVYIPAEISNEITLDVTVDDVTAPVTFNCGKSLLSFVNGHVSDGVGGVAVVDSSAWMAGHTVKYVVDEATQVAWCMVDTIVEDAVSGYVVSVEKALKDNEGNNTYKVTLATTGSVASEEVVYGATYSGKLGKVTLPSMPATISKLVALPSYGYMGAGNMGVSAIVNPTSKVTVYVITEALAEMYIPTNGTWDNPSLTTSSYKTFESGVVKNFLNVALTAEGDASKDKVGNGAYEDRGYVFGYTGLFKADGTYEPNGEIEVDVTQGMGRSKISVNPNSGYAAGVDAQMRAAYLFAAGTFITENDYETYVNSSLKADETYFKKATVDAWQTWVAKDLGANVIFADDTYYVVDVSVTGSKELTMGVLQSFRDFNDGDVDEDNWSLNTHKFVFTHSVNEGDAVSDADAATVLGVYGLYVDGAMTKTTVANETTLNYGTYLSYVGANEKYEVVNALLSAVSVKNVDVLSSDKKTTITNIVYDGSENLCVAGDEISETNIANGLVALGFATKNVDGKTVALKTVSNGTVLTTKANRTTLKANAKIEKAFAAAIESDYFKLVAVDDSTIFDYANCYIDTTYGWTNPVFFLNSGLTAAVIDYEQSTNVATYTVKGSATSIWDYDATTYSTIHNLLVNGNINSSFVNDFTDSYNTDVTANDLLYITLAKDAGDYYTIQGVDKSATLKGSIYDSTDTATGSINLDGLGFELSGGDWGAVRYDLGKGDNCARGASGRQTGWRLRPVTSSYYYPEFTVGAGVAVNWTYYNTNGFNNEHILGYTYEQENGKDKQYNTYFANTEVVNGYYKNAKMYIGVNPYYARTYDATKKTFSYELQFTKVKCVEDVHEVYSYALDLDKTIVYELYYAGTQNQLVDVDGSYAANSKYYVDPKTNYVYGIESDKPTYDAKNATFEGYEFPEETTVTYAGTWTLNSDKVNVITFNYEAAPSVPFSVINNSNLKLNVSEYASLTLKAYTEDESGYVPGKYHANIDDVNCNTKHWNMSETTKVVVITPNAKTGSLDITYTTGKALFESGSTLFVTGYQTKTDAKDASITMISIIGKIIGNPADTKPVDPVTNNNTVSAGKKLVYLGANSNIIADTDETGNLWIVKSESSAYDVTTGAEIGSIQITYNMYLDENQTSASLKLAAGGYYLVDENNEVIVAVEDTKAGTYGNNKTGFATVKTGVLTDANANGKTVATIDGKKNVDVSNYTFKFIYHDMDGNNFGIGGSSTGVSISKTADIEKTYSEYETIISKYNAGNPDETTKDEYNAAVEALAAAKEAAVASYLNGTFWNVEYSPAYRYVQTQQVSYGASANVEFNYVVINDVYYVFVNSFNY